jgi:WD40 repeat protein
VILFLDLESGRVIRELRGHGGGVTDLLWFPDASRLVSASYDRTLRLWNPDRAECVLILRGHTKKAASVSLSDDGTRLVSGAEDRTLRVWDAGPGG